MGRSIAIAAAIVAVLAAAGAYFYFSGSDPGPSGKSLADAAAVLEEVCLQEARDQEIRGRMVRKICACAMESLKKRLPGDLIQGSDESGDEERVDEFFRENFEVFQDCLEKYI